MIYIYASGTLLRLGFYAYALAFRHDLCNDGIGSIFGHFFDLQCRLADGVFFGWFVYSSP